MIVTLNIPKQFNLAEVRDVKNLVRELYQGNFQDVRNEMVMEEKEDGRKVILGSKLVVDGNVLAENNVPGFRNNLLFEDIVGMFEDLKKAENTSAADRTEQQANKPVRSAKPGAFTAGRISAADKAKMAEMSAEGKTAAEIAKALNRTEETIAKVLAKV